MAQTISVLGIDIAKLVFHGSVPITGTNCFPSHAY
jgi:hypothetical protein